MQDGVALLVIASILVGHVFLFLQGRQFRALILGMEERLRGLEVKPGKKAEGPTPVAASPEVLAGVARLEEAIAGLQAPMEGIAKRLRVVEGTLRDGATASTAETAGLADVQEQLTMQAAAFESLRGRLEQLTVAIPAKDGAPAAPAPPAPKAPERVLREWLGLEGYTDCVVGEPTPTEEGLRWPVRALKAGALLKGHVVLDGERVVGARMEVPTSLFP